MKSVRKEGPRPENSYVSTAIKYDIPDGGIRWETNLPGGLSSANPDEYSTKRSFRGSFQPSPRGWQRESLTPPPSAVLEMPPREESRCRSTMEFDDFSPLKHRSMVHCAFLPAQRRPTASYALWRARTHTEAPTGVYNCFRNS